MRDQLMDVLEDLARHHIHTNRGQDRLTNGCFPAEANALKLLAENGRFRITKRYSRTVSGYWPENEPKNEPREGAVDTKKEVG